MRRIRPHFSSERNFFTRQSKKEARPSTRSFLTKEKNLNETVLGMGLCVHTDNDGDQHLHYPKQTATTAEDYAIKNNNETNSIEIIQIQNQQE
jgi:hypothetical protein